jgi:hypothetical protein
MDARPSDLRDPTIGILLSAVCPGLGHLYAGNGLSFAIFFGLELWLFEEGSIWLLVPLHVFQAIAAGGAVKQWNARRGGGPGADVPPPPAAGTGRRMRPESRPASPPPLPAQAPAVPPAAPAAALDADAFFTELQTAWGDYRAARIAARQFADRKWRAIRAVRVEGREEGEALVAAARELADAGVLTSEEIGQLAARVAP